MAAPTPKRTKAEPASNSSNVLNQQTVLPRAIAQRAE